jgi:hypothetical protein
MGREKRGKEGKEGRGREIQTKKVRLLPVAFSQKEVKIHIRHGGWP